MAGTRRVLIGTTNPSKRAYFEGLLSGLGVECALPDELGVAGAPEETGATPEENARLKAAYYGAYCDYALCADSGLYFDALPADDPRQPGLHVRTPDGKRLGDEEMIAHYAALSRALGGRALAYYLDGFAVKTPRGMFGFQSTREEALAWAFYMADMPVPERREGWPLDSLSYDLDGHNFLDPAHGDTRECGYLDRLRAFLRETLGA